MPSGGAPQRPLGIGTCLPCVFREGHPPEKPLAYPGVRGTFHSFGTNKEKNVSGLLTPSPPLLAALSPPHPTDGQGCPGGSDTFPPLECGQPVQETVAGHPGKVVGSPHMGLLSTCKNRRSQEEPALWLPQDVPRPAGIQRKQCSPFSRTRCPRDMYTPSPT